MRRVRILCWADGSRSVFRLRSSGGLHFHSIDATRRPDTLKNADCLTRFVHSLVVLETLQSRVALLALRDLTAR